MREVKKIDFVNMNAPAYCQVITCSGIFSLGAVSRRAIGVSNGTNTDLNKARCGAAKVGG